MAAILLRSRLRWRLTTSSGVRLSILSLLGPPLALVEVDGPGEPGSLVIVDEVEDPEPILCLILIRSPSLMNCDV